MLLGTHSKSEQDQHISELSCRMHDTLRDANSMSATQHNLLQASIPVSFLSASSCHGSFPGNVALFAGRCASEQRPWRT